MPRTRIWAWWPPQDMANFIRFQPQSQRTKRRSLGLLLNILSKPKKELELIEHNAFTSIISFTSLAQPFRRSFTMLILQIRKLRHGEIKQLALGELQGP